MVTEIRDDSGSDSRDSGSDDPSTCGRGWIGEVCEGETDRVLGEEREESSRTPGFLEKPGLGACIIWLGT